MDELVLLAVKKALVDVLQKLMEIVPEGAKDKKLIRDLGSQRQASEQSVLDVVRRLRTPLPVSVWLSIAGSCLYHWGAGGELMALHLQPTAGDVKDDDTVTVVAAATNDLRNAIAYTSMVNSELDGAVLYQGLATALSKLATFMEGAGDSATAYDMLNMSLPFLSDEDPALERVATEGLRLALAGGKPAQICMMSIKLAVAAIARATDSPTSRLAAYAASEVAIERIALAPEMLQRGMAEILRPSIELNKWLQHLRVRMTPFLVNDAGKARVREILQNHDWPTRIENVPLADWWTKSVPVFHLMRGEVEFENERLSLIKQLKPTQITTDAIDWLFSLPDYTHAVPHSGSLLKEQNFPDKLALLVHEITHVLTFLGGLGAALLALRVAGFRIASELWRFPEGVSPDALMDTFRSKKGIADLEPNNAVLLLSAERQLETRLKAQLLLDIWTAWTEGLAVFGELGADPALDEVGINPVTECLRNLVDFFADAGKPGGPSEQMVEHYKEFERQCSAAFHETGTSRLGDYLRRGDRAYLHGYITLRAIASRWRLQTGRNLTSAQCFDVFLHATRYALHPFIPDLGLPSDTFAKKAEEGLAAFVTALANLSAKELEIYLRREDPTSRGQLIGWENGRVRTFDEAEIARAIEEQKARSRLQIEQALRSLTGNHAFARLSAFEPEAAELVLALTEHGQAELDGTLNDSETLDGLLAVLESLLTRGSILPIGRCSSPFFLHIDKEGGHAQMCVNIRTAEAFKETGKPSYNGFWFPQSVDSAEELRARYQSHAIPRVDITRVIILSEIDVAGSKMRFPHLFAFQYPDWFDIRGTSQWAQHIETLDKRTWDGYAAIIARRLDTDELRLIESRFVASGSEAIHRTLEWLGKSDNWRLATKPVNAGSWAKHLKRLAERLLNEPAREAVRQKSIVAILRAIYWDDDRARKIASTNFRNILGIKPGLSDQLVTALHETGCRSCESEFLEQNAKSFKVGELALFQRGPFGWDMTPANLKDTNYERTAVP